MICLLRTLSKKKILKSDLKVLSIFFSFIFFLISLLINCEEIGREEAFQEGGEFIWTIHHSTNGWDLLPMQTIFQKMFSLYSKEDLLSNPQALQNVLAELPWVKNLYVTFQKPSSLYIHYSLRTPIAYLDCFPNVAVDEEGYLFPTAFFSAKNLPQLSCSLSKEECEHLVEQLALYKRVSLHSPLYSFFLSILLRYQESLIIEKVSFQRECRELSNLYQFCLQVREEKWIQKEDNSFLLSIPRTLILQKKNYEEALRSYLLNRERLFSKEQDEEDVKEYKDQRVDLRVAQMICLEPLRTL